MANFKIAYEIGAANEGGYVHDPMDSGGETYKGIARKFHGDWACWELIDMYGEKFGKGTPAFKQALELEPHIQNMVIEFYRTRFWDKVMGDKITQQAIANELYDTAINQGVGQAVKCLQQALNLLNDGGKHYADIAEDGAMGNGTLAALNAYFMSRPGTTAEKVLLKAMNGIQFMRYVEVTKRSPKNERFFYGWLNTRIAMMLVLIGFTAAFGCRTAKEVTTEATVTDASKTDSVRIEERMVYVPVEVPGETVWVPIDNPCDSVGNLKPIETVVKGAKNATVSVSTKDNVLLISGGCDAWRDSVAVLQTKLESFKTSNSATSSTKETVKHIAVTPKWLRFHWLLLYAVAIYAAGHFRLGTKLFTLIRKLIIGI